MRRLSRMGVLMLLLAAALAAETARAESWLGRRDPGCGRPVYSPAHHWTPTLVRWWQGLRGFSVGDDWLYPDIPGDVRIMPSPCRFAEPTTIPYGIGASPAMVIPVYRYGTIPPASE